MFETGPLVPCVVRSNATRWPKTSKPVALKARVSVNDTKHDAESQETPEEDCVPEPTPTATPFVSITVPAVDTRDANTSESWLYETTKFVPLNVVEDSACEPVDEISN